MKNENDQGIISLLEWGVATQAAAGQTESGDRHLVEPFPDGVLAAVVDGLGHGPHAAAVAETAVGTMEGYVHEPPGSLLERCHRALRSSRGVVMSLASFNTLDGTMTWLGVGNVNGVLLRADSASAGRTRELLLPRGGVVGYRLPTLRPVALPVWRGDLLLFITDGIRSSFAQDLKVSDPPQQIADDVLARYGRGTDDALVLVARYLGKEAA